MNKRNKYVIADMKNYRLKSGQEVEITEEYCDPGFEPLYRCKVIGAGHFVYLHETDLTDKLPE